ncbi:unnamed protein product [Hymenolepis diminuta]|uniref:Multiple inositol polyphosphate phosphatase 1 n=1 Tax=Hymenolepis diminuta TaxID=6216 RepID=A0A564Y1M1_HYMDI|nr:unnamed protein product [Hymenolepis diminuta]
MPRALMDIPGILFLCVGLVLYYFVSTNLPYDESLVGGYSLTAFGSKTAYKNNGLKSEHDSFLNCKRLVHVNVLHRHGTRSPDAKFSKKVEKYRNLLEPLLPGWNFSTKSCGAGEKVLLPSGHDELEGIGRRMRKLLPEEFYRASNMRAVSSDTQRTLASAKSFLSTFTDDKVDIFIDQERVRFFAFCNNYFENIRSGDIAKAEYNKFKDGPEMHAVLKEVIVDHKLESLGLTTSDIANLYKVASYEVSVMDENATLPDWVRLFRPNHLYVLEYLHDLKQYWTKGNAFQVNYEQVCPLWGKMLVDMRESANYDIQLIEAKISGSNESIDKLIAPPKSVFWFGHAETLLPMVAKLGMFNESVASEHGGGSHLSADGFPSRLQRLTLDDLPVSNLFRSSHIIPFGANLGFFLFYDPIKNAKPSLDDYCIEVRLNEEVVEMIPQDKNATRPLRLGYVLKYFHDCLPENYDIRAVCGIKTKTERVIPE